VTIWYNAGDESIFSPDIPQFTLWECPQCHNCVSVPEVGLYPCPVCHFFPNRWHSNLEDGPDGG
jgi:hypothetical protein